MSETSVIREFLVALGFKKDDGALQQFEKGINQATKTVLGLAAAIETTAVLVAAGVTRFASNLEALYFASIKANASATNLKALDRAAQNLGTQAGEALQSVQGLARFLRQNPGGEGLLANLGVETRDVNGQLRDTTDILLGLAKQFQAMPFYLASQYASIFGISEDTLRAMRSGGFEAEVLRMREFMQTTGFDQASKDAHRFMMGLRDLTTQLERFGVQVYDALAKRLGGGLGDLTDWLRLNGPAVAARVAEILVKLIDLAERVGRGVAWLIEKFVEWDKATDGWSTRLLGLLVVLRMFGGFAIISGIVRLAGAFVGLAGGMTTSAAAATGLIGLLTRLSLVAAAATAGVYAGRAIYDKLLPQGAKDSIGEGIAATLAMFGNREARESLATNDPLMFMRLSGWSKEQAAGILANLQAESGMNPQAVGDNGQAYGVAQWHPDRQAAFQKWSGKNMRDSTLAEQLDFMNFELKRGAEQRAGALLAASRTPQQSAEVIARYYERPASIDREVAKRSEAAVHISQETTIKVDGGPDPHATGRAVANEQNRVNAQLTRNMQVAVQ